MLRGDGPGPGGGKTQWVIGFGEWAKAETGVNSVVAFGVVPENREANYTTPAPAVRLNELEDVDNIQTPCAAP